MQRLNECEVPRYGGMRQHPQNRGGHGFVVGGHQATEERDAGTCGGYPQEAQPADRRNREDGQRDRRGPLKGRQQQNRKGMRGKVAGDLLRGRKGGGEDPAFRKSMTR